MNITEKSIISPVDFNSRFVQNLVYEIMNIKSTPYIATLDRNVNAKSILGLLSADIRKGDSICVQIINTHNQQQAVEDLEYVLNKICGEINES